MAIGDLVNRFSKNDDALGLNQLRAVKDHIAEYFLMGNTEDGLVDLKLDIIGDETLTADCDVTDHYVESNTAYQDQISLKPKIYTINGEVGELVWYQKDKSSQIVGQVAQRLEGVISFLPVSSRSFTQFKKKAMKAAQWVDTASNAVSKLSNLMSLDILNEKGEKTGTRSVTNQEQAYQYLVSFRDTRSILTIKTPWGILKDYVITNLSFNQTKETRDKTSISITFKEFRTVSLGEWVPFDTKKYQGNAVYENQPVVDDGKTAGTDVGTAEQEIDEEGNMFYRDTVKFEEKEYEYKYYPEDGFADVYNKDGTQIDFGSAEYDNALNAMKNKIGYNIQEGIFKE